MQRKTYDLKKCFLLCQGTSDVISIAPLLSSGMSDSQQHP